MVSQQAASRAKIDIAQTKGGSRTGNSPFPLKVDIMDIKIIFQTARCVTLEAEDGSIYESAREREVYVNGALYRKTNRTIFSIYGLKPQTEYEILVKDAEEEQTVMIRTDDEFVTLNVRDFGAKGDGVQDDTHFIQAAIMSCPKESRVLIPEGTYKITSLFLKDDIRIELAKGALLLGETDRRKFAILKGLVDSYDETAEYNLGTWEGNPLDCFAALITGVNVKNVVIYGQGVVDGNASFENWWKDPKEKNIAFRPRMIFLNHCENVTIQGICVQNSPSWNVHPYFSDHLRFVNMEIINPKVSPNTDGLDPESCHDVEVVGVYISVGDDCIAVKSGKIYMGRKYKRACENLVIRQCCMRDGHGSITVGSEMAGGVRNMTVQDCVFLNTDRGLRIKTRRGRGQDAVLDEITFAHIRMDHVKTPFVVNCFYFCDPDGHTEYVQTKETLPVDERTPEVRHLVFRDIDASNCHLAAAFMYGLPERKIQCVEMENIKVSYAPEAQPGQIAMMEGIEERCHVGIYANNIETLVLKNVEITGQDGEPVTAENVDHLIRE